MVKLTWTGINFLNVSRKGIIITRVVVYRLACFYNILNVQEDQKVDDSSAFEELGRLGEEIDLLPDRTNTEPEKQRKQERFANKERPEEKRMQYTTRGKRQTNCRGTQRQFSGKYLFGKRFEI